MRCTKTAVSTSVIARYTSNGQQAPICLHKTPRSLVLPKLASQSALQAVQLHATANTNIFCPPVVDISNVIAGRAPTLQQAQQVQQECLSTGFLAITGHGISEAQLQQLFHAAESFFDLPMDLKRQTVVEDMQRGRGYEISPEHKQYMEQYSKFPQQQHQQLCNEPSAVAGILSERFCCGPPLTDSQLQHPYYTSELGQVFFTADSWPTTTVPELQPVMQECYKQCEVISAAVLRLFAAALGVPHDYFQDKTDRHHSNMQVANYPSQLIEPGPNNLRKKAHVDSGTLTLLASQDWAPGSGWKAGDGGLQLLNSQGQWVEVEVPQGALLLNLGSLMTRWTNGMWKSTLHRVTNPVPQKAHSSRRLSMAFFHKPNYDAVIEVLPTCYQSREALTRGQAWHEPTDGAYSSNIAAEWRCESLRQRPLPARPRFPAVTVGEITRQGILHKYRHLPQEEASRKYHEELLAMRSLDCK